MSEGGSRAARTAPSGAEGPKDGGQAAAEPPPPEPPSARRRPSAGQALASVGAVIGVLAGLTGLIDWFEGRAEEPPPPSPPPSVIDARIERAVLDSRSESLGAFLADVGQPTTGLSRRERREEGLLFSVRVRLRGNRGQPLPLLWRMYDDETGRRVAGARYAQEAASFTPGNEDHSATVPIWAPHPPDPGTYYVRFLLVDTKRRPIGDRRTRPFTLTGVSAA